MATLNEGIDSRYLTNQCSKQAMASGYKYKFKQNLNLLDILFSDVEMKHLLHHLKPVESSEETMASYVHKR
eukprot:10951957-Ditylum_brightwellii.AAC.1